MFEKFLFSLNLHKRGDYMKTGKQEYSKMTEKASPNSSLVQNCVWAFVVGGGICMLGEALYNFYRKMNFTLSDARLLASITLVGLSALFTAMGWYGKLAKRAGAGTLVPITGFANAVVSPALEFNAEGFVTGVGTKMFIIAGPVIVYGVLASVVYGLVLFYIIPFLR